MGPQVAVSLGRCERRRACLHGRTPPGAAGRTAWGGLGGAARGSLTPASREVVTWRGDVACSASTSGASGTGSGARNASSRAQGRRVRSQAGRTCKAVLGHAEGLPGVPQIEAAADDEAAVRPESRRLRRHQRGTRCRRDPSVAVRENTDGAPRPSCLREHRRFVKPYISSITRNITKPPIY